MTLKDDWITYLDRWRAVAEIEKHELRTASIETKWQQLNSIINLAKTAGIFKPDSSEKVVYQRWAKLKQKAGKWRR
jgi:hypothetical protein